MGGYRSQALPFGVSHKIVSRRTSCRRKWKRKNVCEEKKQAFLEVSWHIVCELHEPRSGCYRRANLGLCLCKLSHDRVRGADSNGKGTSSTHLLGPPTNGPRFGYWPSQRSIRANVCPSVEEIQVTRNHQCYHQYIDPPILVNLNELTLCYFSAIAPLDPQRLTSLGPGLKSGRSN